MHGVRRPHLLVPVFDVAYPGVRDNRSTLNTKTGYDDDVSVYEGLRERTE